MDMNFIWSGIFDQRSTPCHDYPLEVPKQTQQYYLLKSSIISFQSTHSVMKGLKSGAIELIN